ncbi:MAG: TIR domain-containing protein [Lachnospiraceae bacterium]|nr:TIR domain-containing protein [Lachnospiraceae bacterium]
MSDNVFISYSSKDAKIVKKIIQKLTDEGIAYWKAPEMIPAGSNYAREIPRAIESCKVFVLMISESSQESIWVEKEIDCAINARKTIVPLNLTGVPMCEMFRFYLNNVQTIDYSQDERYAMQQFIERLKALAGREEVADASNEAAQTGLQEERQKAYSNSLSAAVNRMELPKGRRLSSGKTETVFAPVSADRNNALNLNQIPVNCEYCGGQLKQIARGIYACVDCGEEAYDSYQKVRNYLNSEGPRSVTQIMRATGVPRATIEYFLKDERLEIPMGDSARIICSGCGALIRTGVLCEKCKAKGTKKQEKIKLGDDKYRFLKRD